jgi:hypothetical protein
MMTSSVRAELGLRKEKPVRSGVVPAHAVVVRCSNSSKRKPGVFMKSLLGLALAATSVFYTFEANAAQFSCSGGDVTCLITSINSANQRGGKHTITLEPGVYTLTAVDNTVSGNTTLPVIRGNIRIRAAKHARRI